MRRISLIAVLAVAAVAPAAWSQQTVDLYGFKTVAGVEYAQSAAYFTFKFCKVGSAVCNQGTLGSTGNATFTVTQGAGQYNLFLYRNYGYTWNGGEWGSLDIPIAGGSFTVGTSWQYPYSISASVPPRPLPPTLVSPCNGCQVPSSNFYLKWTNGLDADRSTSAWPVTYDIWASETPVGWSTQPEHLTVADAPCNPDANGNCQWWVNALVAEPGRRYTWRIVVKLNVGGGVVYTTSGPSWSIHQ